MEGLRTWAFPHSPVSLAVRAGEIVGLAGLVGSGRSALLRTIFGVDRRAGPRGEGVVRVGDRVLPAHRPRAAIAAGLAFAPEDRRRSGLVVEQDVAANLQLARLREDSGRLGFLRPGAFRATAQDLVDRLRIRTGSLRQPVSTLSGGNQQKIVLGKWLAMAPRVLLLDEPTRGIDIGAKAEIYQLMDHLAAEGVAILFASSEMEELLGVADRLVVLHEGRVAGHQDRPDFDEVSVMHLATGRGVVG